MIFSLLSCPCRQLEYGHVFVAFFLHIPMLVTTDQAAIKVSWKMDFLFLLETRNGQPGWLFVNNIYSPFGERLTRIVSKRSSNWFHFNDFSLMKEGCVLIRLLR